MFVDEKIKDKVDFLYKSQRKTLSDILGFEYLHLSPEKIIARMPVDERTHQLFGLLHGGASVAFAETIASLGGWLNLDLDTERAVGMEINANHLRPISSGYVTGVALPVHIGKRSHVWEVQITSEDNKLICISRCTLAVIAAS